MNKKKFAKRRESKKTKSALVSLLEDYLSDEDSESEGITSIVKDISNLKKDKKKKAKLFSTEDLKDQSKSKGGENISKHLKIINSVE